MRRTRDEYTRIMARCDRADERCARAEEAKADAEIERAEAREAMAQYAGRMEEDRHALGDLNGDLTDQIFELRNGKQEAA